MAINRIPTDMIEDRVTKQKLSDQLSDIATNVKSYGAKGDGTNETTVLQTIINSLAGKMILLPYGSSYNINTLTIPDNTVIWGYGAKLYNISTHQTLLSLGNGVKIYGLELQGAGNSTFNANGKAIEFKGADASNYKTGLTLQDCNIHDFGAYGIYLEYVKDVRINNTDIKNIGYSGVMGLSVTNVKVDKCKVKGVSPGSSNLAYGIVFTRQALTNSLVTYPRSKDCVVSNCNIEDVTIWEALDTHAGDNIKFVNNTVRNCKVGIVLTPTGLSGVEDYAPINCSVIGNNIYGIGTGAGIVIAGAKNISGTSTESAYGNVIKGNTLVTCGEQGNSIGGAIYLRDTRGLVLEGNSLKDCYAIGINLYNTNFGFSIIGNTIIDVQDNTVTTASGICFRTEYNKGTVSGNTLLLVNVALNTYVSKRGIYFATATNQEIGIGVNYNTFELPMFTASGTHVYYTTFGNGTSKLYAVNGSPEGVVTATVGSLCVNLSGGAGISFYVKETGSGNTGWVAK